MLSLKACFGRFSVFVFFVCLSTQSLFSIDSYLINSSKIKNEDLIHKYNDYGEEYAYLDDDPIDISLELDPSSHLKENNCKKEPEESQVNHCNCSVCQSHCCKRGKFQRFFSVYDVGKIVAVVYVIYRTRNIIKVAVISADKTMRALDYCFEGINYVFGVMGGLNVL